MSLQAGSGNVTQSDYDKVDVTGVYNKLGADYEEYILDDEGRQRCVEWVLNMLSEQGIKRGRVVDLGCASGVPVTATLAAAGHDVVGVDLSDGQIELASERVPDARFVVADMRSWEPSNESFESIDALVTFYALPHLSLPDCRRMLSRIHGWLRAGGVVAIGMVSGVQGKVKWFGFDITGMSMSLEEMRKLLDEMGFEVVNIWEEEWTSNTKKDAKSKLNQFFCARKRGQN